MLPRHLTIFHVACLLLIANAPGLAITASSFNPWIQLTTVLAPGALVSLAFYALLPRFSLWLFCLAIPLALMETLYVLRYGRATDEHVFAIIKETNAQEAVAWLSPGGCLLLVGGVLAMGAGMLLTLRHSTLSIRLSARWRAILALAGLVAFGVVSAPDLLELHLHAPESPVLTAPAHAALGHEISTQLTGVVDQPRINDLFPWGLPSRIQRYQALQEGMDSARQALFNFSFGSKQSPARSSDEEVFVLVIGETGRPDHWQLNGYERPTTPRLSEQDGVISFTNVITGWAWTRMSVPVIVSRKPSSSNSSFFPERSIISAFKEAGFWTAWYSMHGPLGFHESAVALYAGEADDTRYLNPAGYRSPGTYDEALLKPLADALSRPNIKKLIVLHTMGSHFNYAHRAPPNFEIFLPSLRERRDADLHDRAQRDQLNNSYDNSIRYTDHVLAEIIQRLEKTNQVATLLYVADHGENLFDGGCDKAGHGHNTERDYRIAALWWNSAEFSRRYPEHVASISARRSTPWATENVFNTLLDAAGITTHNSSHGGQSLLQPEFSPQPRWIQSGGYFDSAQPEGVCGALKIVGAPNVSKRGVHNRD